MEDVTEQRPKKTRRKYYPFITPEERLAIWEKARGMWKDREPDPITELDKMRSEWDRELPRMHE